MDHNNEVVEVKIGSYYRIVDNKYSWGTPDVGVFTGKTKEDVFSFRLADMSKKDLSYEEISNKTEPHNEVSNMLPRYSIQKTDKGTYLEAIDEALKKAWNVYRDALEKRDALMKYAQREETNDTVKKIINYIKSLNK